MATSQLRMVLQHVHKLAEMSAAEEHADDHLLEKFVEHGEESAFAALVRRHGPMVLGVCQRVLRDSHEAEDVFQATFLVLLRRAAHLKRRGSLAGWLHTVAYHAALKARAGAIRRNCEQREISAMAAEPDTEILWRDLRPILDEELSRLPEKYRDAIALCYLEGKTCEQAGKLLGCKTGTVKSRLARGRQLLQGRLVQRGVTLSGALLITALTERATAAVSMRLLDATMQSALLSLSGKTVASSAAALAEGVVQSMLTTKIKVGVILLIAVGILGLGGGLVRHRAAAQNHVEKAALKAFPSAELAKKKQDVFAPDKAEKQEATKGQQVTLSGRVLDASGKPVADANVALLTRQRNTSRHYDFYWKSETRCLCQSKTDAQGRFRLQVAGLSSKRWGNTVVFARAPGHGVGHHVITLGAIKQRFDKFDITLPREKIRRGRLIGLQGQPAAGVRVEILNLRIAKPGGMYSAVTHFGEPPQKLALWPVHSTTDRNGNFTLRGLGASYDAMLLVRDDRFARDEFSFSPTGKLAGKDWVKVLEPARVIEGQVVFADTGKPVPRAEIDVEVRVQQRSGGFRVFLHRVVADKAGRFRAVPHAGGSRNRGSFPADAVILRVHPPHGSPYLGQRKELSWPRVDIVKQTVKLQLPRGVLLKGRIIEQASGKPVAGATLAYRQFRDDNPFLREDLQTPVGKSGQDGKFQMTVPRGPGHLLINAPTNDYVHEHISTAKLMGSDVRPNRRHFADAIVAVNLKANAGTHSLKVTLHRGKTVKGEVIGPENQSIKWALLFSPTWIPHSYDLNGVSPRPVSRGRFELPGCPPDKEVRLIFLDVKNQWGAMANISGKQPNLPRPIRLQHCGKAKATFVDAQGKPVPGIRVIVEMVLLPGPSFFQSVETKEIIGDTVFMSNHDRRHHQLKTDAKGQVAIPTLIPGVAYRISGRLPNGRYRTLTEDFTVKSREVHDLGKITVKSS